MRIGCDHWTGTHDANGMGQQIRECNEPSTESTTRLRSDAPRNESGSEARQDAERAKPDNRMRMSTIQNRMAMSCLSHLPVMGVSARTHARSMTSELGLAIEGRNLGLGVIECSVVDRLKRSKPSVFIGAMGVCVTVTQTCAQRNGSGSVRSRIGYLPGPPPRRGRPQRG